MKRDFFALLSVALCAAALCVGLASCEKETSIEKQLMNGHKYVDLGLPSGLMWATCNVGASSPEKYGDYFAWGETEEKDEYSWSTYKWCNGDQPVLTFTKYNTGNSPGTADHKTTLDLSDDAAHANWGGDWRIPTLEEWNELRNSDNVTWEWTRQKDVSGYLVTSKYNGNSIFLPEAGFRRESDLVTKNPGGDYWTSSLLIDPYDSGSAWNVDFGYDWQAGDSHVYDHRRCIGRSVRPVCQIN